MQCIIAIKGEIVGVLTINYEGNSADFDMNPINESLSTRVHNSKKIITEEFLKLCSEPIQAYGKRGCDVYVVDSLTQEDNR